ncbi:MAG: hypothetical protein FWF99_00015 [Desulfovibrionaceae bacterium]|nr:hypothetical protein [Desulfovibrionaceae bacterium]
MTKYLPRDFHETMTAMVACTKDIEVCLAVSRAVENTESKPLFYDRLIAPAIMRVLILSVVRHVRSLESLDLIEESNRTLHTLGCELCNWYTSKAEFDWLTHFLLKKPFAELEELCAVLSLNSDPEARKLIEKFVAKSAPMTL